MLYATNEIKSHPITPMCTTNNEPLTLTTSGIIMDMIDHTQSFSLAWSSIFLAFYISVETNSVNIRIIDCYTNYSNISEVFEYSVLSHALNVITPAQQTKQVQAMAKCFWSL